MSKGYLQPELLAQIRSLGLRTVRVMQGAISGLHRTPCMDFLPSSRVIASRRQVMTSKTSTGACTPGWIASTSSALKTRATCVRTLPWVRRGRFVWSYQIKPVGSLRYKQPFHHLHLPDTKTGSFADGMTVDRSGRLYVATEVGLQVCDQPGRVNVIINKPQRGPLSNVVFAGPNLGESVVTCGEKVFKRKVNACGVRPCAEVGKPPKPRL
tara:strand:+ start:3136 stop:3768 length:633 start_codon:yes stop_codon:yes gene_type:complete